MTLLTSLPKNPQIGDPRLVSDLIANDTALLAAVQNIELAQMGTLCVGTAQLVANAVTPAKVGTVPHARLYNSVDQSIPNNTTTAVAFDLEDFDSDAMHSNVTNNSRLTCVTAGVYLIQARATFASNATGTRTLQLIKNGATGGDMDFRPAVSGQVTMLKVNELIRLAAADYVQAVVTQTSGGALNSFGNGINYSSFEAVWLGP